MRNMTQVIKAALGTLAAALTLMSCGQEHGSSSEGNAARGRELLDRYGCNACHRISGVRDAVGTVGPPLDDIGSHVYIAGTIPNSAPNLARWIQTPQAYKPGTAMPNLNVTDPDARDMAAYLDGLR